jgi:hypothetical protein
MSQENMEVVKAAWDAFGEGGLEAAESSGPSVA